MATLVLEQGHLCIREVHESSAEPVRTIHYWPIRRMAQWEWDSWGSDWREAVWRYNGDGVYVAYINGQHVSAVLQDRGNTLAILQVSERIPCPRTRQGTPVRWRNGRWEKYLKRDGWVRA